MCWTALDSRLVTVGVDGAVHTWDVAAGTKLRDEYVLSVPLAGGVCTADGSRVFCPAVDRKIRVIASAK